MADTDVTVQTLIDNSIIRGRDLDKENDRIVDAQLLKFVNKAREYVHKLLIQYDSEIGKETDTITMSGGTQEYTLEGNLDDFWVMSPNGVYFGTTPLIPVTYQEKIRVGSAMTDSAPTMYYLTKDKIGLVQTPSEVAAAAYPTLNCRYFKYPTALALTDNMPYKNAFNEAISAFMSSMGALAAEKSTAEFTAIYNALEESTLDIINRRIPL